MSNAWLEDDVQWCSRAVKKVSKALKKCNTRTSVVVDLIAVAIQPESVQHLLVLEQTHIGDVSVVLTCQKWRELSE